MKQAKKEYSFTNSAGETFKILPLNPLEEQVVQEQIDSEWKAAGRAIPAPPSYEVTTVTGEVQKIQLKRREEADTDELRAAWDAYAADDAAYQREMSERMLISYFLCVEADPDAYPQWKARMRLKKISVPEDEGEKLLLFCKTHVLRSKDDLLDLIFAVTSTIAEVSEEVVQAAQDKFRREMEKAQADIQLDAA